MKKTMSDSKKKSKDKNLVKSPEQMMLENSRRELLFFEKNDATLPSQ